MKLRLLFSLLFGAVLSSGFSQSVGLIGSATPGGWAADTNMVQSVDSAHLWSLNIRLTAGAAKFRQDDDWAVNWGAADFPSGIGTQNGADIPIPAAGDFTVTFNSQTGAYRFTVSSAIGIIGNATPGGWADDTNMFQDPLDTNKYFLTLPLVIGEAKFRANDAWTINWGSTDFPSGIATQDGMNIPIPATGNYLVNFDKSTGAYSFEEVIAFNSIGIIGSATAGGWDTDTELTKDNADPNIWKGNVDLIDGEVKFRANGAWTINWGGTDFPTGTGVQGSNDNIPVDSGTYLVTFNTETFEYSFLPIITYGTVGIIGDATPGGWENDTDMEQDPVDPAVWRLRIILTDGLAKFRAENDWAVNWGAGDFPSGIGVQDGAEIPIPAGEYKVTFNTTTGAYSFEELIIFSTVGIIGTATPGLWAEDTDMTKDAVDESFWFMNAMDLVDGEAKFRAENAWAVNWGLASWPSGIGTQDGPNIPVTAGTYRITLNAATGEYAFSDPTSTTNLLDANSISIAPNPAKDVLNITVTAQEMKGDVRVILFNQLGQQVLTTNLNIQDKATLQVGSVQPGVYTLHMTNGKSIVGKQVVIVK
jgi:starch-binding outer membrane protein SusE/F